MKKIVTKVKKCLKINKDGTEKLCNKPMSVPIGFKQPPTLQQQIKQMIRSEKLQMAAMEAGHETFEESEDFDIGDDYDPTAPYELGFDSDLDYNSNQGGFQEEKPIEQEAPASKEKANEVPNETTDS